MVLHHIQFFTSRIPYCVFTSNNKCMYIHICTVFYVLRLDITVTKVTFDLGVFKLQMHSGKAFDRILSQLLLTRVVK